MDPVRAYLAEIGRKGGKVVTEKKLAAIRRMVKERERNRRARAKSSRAERATARNAVPVAQPDRATAS